MDPLYYQPDNPLLADAYACVWAGVCPIPVAADCEHPAYDLLPAVWDAARGRYIRSLSVYRDRPPTSAELSYWFIGPRPGPPCRLGVMCGQASCGLQVLVLGTRDLFLSWRHRLRVPVATANLFERLVIIENSQGGAQVYFRTPPEEEDLLVPTLVEYERTAEGQVKILTELKAEGAIAVVPEYLRNFNAIPMLTVQERAKLIGGILGTKCKPRGAPSALDLFKARTSWCHILRPHGWTLLRKDTVGREFWRSPGVTSGICASINYDGCDQMYVFSELAPPFRADREYDKVTAFAMLYYDGDVEAATRAF